MMCAVDYAVILTSRLHSCCYLTQCVNIIMYSYISFPSCLMKSLRPKTAKCVYNELVTICTPVYSRQCVWVC